MPTFLLSNWRWIAIFALAAALFGGGMHYQRLVDGRRADALLQAQHEADARAQAELDRRAKAAELELAAERTKAADLATRWETERHEKSHTVCTLSAGSVRLLQDATRD